MPTGIRLTEDIKNKVVCFYKSKPISIKECANVFNLSSPTIMKILDEFGIERYKKAQVFNPNMKEDYFNSIDTEEKAYFLGLLITDGNVFSKDSKRQSSISITLSSEDSYMLDRFVRSLGVNTSVSTSGGTSYVAVRSDIMANDLARYGVVPRKTLKSYLPSCVDRVFMRHLIRGILDGDGCSRYHKDSRGGYRFGVSFCGTFRIVSDIKEFLVSELGVKDVSVYSYIDRNLSDVSWQSLADFIKICDWMYDDSHIFLERKRNRYLKVKSTLV